MSGPRDLNTLLPTSLADWLVLLMLAALLTVLLWPASPAVLANLPL